MKDRVKIEIIDNVVARILEGKKIVQPLVSFEAVYFQQGQKRKIRKSYQKSLIFNKNFIYIGWIERIRNHCRENKIPFLVSGEVESLKPTRQPRLKGIKFRDYQTKAIKTVCERQSGVVEAIMGAGKTILAAGIISAYPGKKVLFLCPNLDLVSQAHNSFIEAGLKSKIVSRDDKKITNANVIVSNMQIFKTLDLIDLSIHFDILFVDETHLAIKKGGTLEKILSMLMAPVRIGLTATLPKDEESKLQLEGLIGPVIFKVDANEGIDQGFLVKPTVKLIPVPEDGKLKQIINYKAIYKAGIVENKVRNGLIVDEVKSIVAKKKTVIVFILEIKHMENLSKMMKKEGIAHECVFGETETIKRDRIKKQLTSGKINVVIASVVWVAGLDIKTLSYIILGAGGRSETRALQAIGRVLRSSDGKTNAHIIDFLDPYRHLAEHTVQRVSILVNMDWI